VKGLPHVIARIEASAADGRDVGQHRPAGDQACGLSKGYAAKTATLSMTYLLAIMRTRVPRRTHPARRDHRCPSATPRNPDEHKVPPDEIPTRAQVTAIWSAAPPRFPPRSHSDDSPHNRAQPQPDSSEHGRCRLRCGAYFGRPGPRSKHRIRTGASPVSGRTSAGAAAVQRVADAGKRRHARRTTPESCRRLRRRAGWGCSGSAQRNRFRDGELTPG
jgi:hypothetical protein